MSVAVLLAYAIGVTLGILAARVTAFGLVWPKIVRTQLLLVAIALSITSVWSIDGIDSVVWPALMVAALAVMTLVSRLTVKGPSPDAHAALQTWAAGANSGFFVVPVATVVAGPAGAVAAVLMDRMSIPLYSYWTHLLRRSAPIPQRMHTSWIDQSPLIALGVGLVLRMFGTAPDWAHAVTLVAAPILAASGSAVFIGSVLHPSQRIDPRPGVRRWLALSSLRVALFLAIAVAAPTEPLRIVAILCALTIPVFAAPQMCTVYGYTEPAVAAGSRYGWFFGAAGLAAVALLVR